MKGRITVRKTMTKFLGTSTIASLLALTMALPAVAQTTGTSTATSTPGKAVSEVKLACIQSAVTKRDTAIGAAIDAYYNTEKSALTARTSALNNAWGISDRKARREALRTAWKAFKDSSKSAQKAFRTAKKAAWDGFITDRKACGKGAASDDPVGRGVDEKSL